MEVGYSLSLKKKASMHSASPDQALYRQLHHSPFQVNEAELGEKNDPASSNQLILIKKMKKLYSIYSIKNTFDEKGPDRRVSRIFYS